MTRKELQEAAKDRLRDAKALLGRKRWTGAYYLTGCAVECGLKACVIKRIAETAVLFGDEKFLKALAGCWTHELQKLVQLAGMEAEFGLARGADAALQEYWNVTLLWSETARYQIKDEQEARALYQAVSAEPGGILPWVRSRW